MTNSTTGMNSAVKRTTQLTATLPEWMRAAVEAHSEITTESMSGLVRRGLVLLAEHDLQWKEVFTTFKPGLKEVIEQRKQLEEEALKEIQS